MSCHSASVRSEVYRIRSVLRECIYIVQTKIADFIDAFWVFKQALRLGRSGNVTVRPGHIGGALQRAVTPTQSHLMGACVGDGQGGRRRSDCGLVEGLYLRVSQGVGKKGGLSNRAGKVALVD